MILQELIHGPSMFDNYFLAKNLNVITILAYTITIIITITRNDYVDVIVIATTTYL